MTGLEGDKRFAGSIPHIYETYLVPLLFEPYASDLAARVAARAPRRVLELAAGTGVLTRALDAVLSEPATIVATDLNRAMLDVAAVRATRRHVEWRAADAMRLPFAEGSFDAVACQCGVMFFPDKPAAFREARRVLQPGGSLVFSVWDRIEESEIAQVVEETLAEVFPDAPPAFLGRTPHCYHDLDTIRLDLAHAGFEGAPGIVAVRLRSRAPSAREAAIAYCQGTPLRNEIEALDAGRLEQATDRVAAALTRRWGSGRIDASMQAFVVSIDS